MQCLSRDEIEEYIMGAPLSQKQQTAEHITSCPHCLSLYHKQIEEQSCWSDELFVEALSDSFTSKVMASLEKEQQKLGTISKQMQENMGHDSKPIAVYPDQVNGPSVSETINETLFAPKKGGLFKRREAGFWKLTVGAASLLILLVGSVIMYSVPTLAETLRSLFGYGKADIGLLRAQEFGLVEHPNIKVKDKGYTIKIDEAVADPTRVIIALQLFGPDGKQDRNRLVLTPENNIQIKDNQGQVVGKLYDMGVTNDFYYLVAFFPEPLRTDRITVEGRITQLGNKFNNIPYLKGKWNFDFSIDMKEANKKTTITPLNESYTSPDGMTVRLKRLTRMVQGVRLELDTELSEEALARSPGDLWKQQGLKFHFEDMQGNEIHSVNARKSPHRESLMTESQLPGDKPGLMHLSYTFKYLPQDSPYTFVFDGYFVSERDDASIQFKPSKLKNDPISFRFDGDDLLLQDFSVESPPNTNGNVAEGALHLSGRLRNEDRQSQWILKDPDGKEYTVTMRGSSSTEASGWKDGSILLGGYQPGRRFEFRAPGLTTVPDWLQLTRTVVDRLYSNGDWSVPMKENGKQP